MAAMRAKGVSPRAAAFQQVLHNMHSPEQLFFEEMPKAVGCGKGLKATVDTTKRVIDELTNIISIYQHEIEDLLRNTFDIDRAGTKVPLTSIVQNWVMMFPPEVRAEAFDFVGKRFCEIILAHQDSDERLIDSIALILVGKGLIHWDDTTYLRFKNKLFEQTTRMQNQFLGFESENDYEGNVAKLLSSQIHALYEQYANRVSEKEASAMLKMILESK